MIVLAKKNQFGSKFTPRSLAGAKKLMPAKFVRPLSLPEIKSGRTGGAILPGAAWQ